LVRDTINDGLKSGDQKPRKWLVINDEMFGKTNGLLNKNK